MNTTGMSKGLRRVSAWAGAVCLATLVAACGGGGGGEPPPTPSGTATIGSEGGSFSSAEGVRITVPAGAMAEAITLRVARDTTGLHAALASGTPDPDKAVALSPTYAMTPHGTTFSQPVELRIPIDRAAAAGPGLLVALRTDPGKPGWDVLPIKAVENGEAVVAITSFSYYKVVKIVRLPQQLPNTLPAPPKLEMSMTLGGAAPTSFIMNDGPVSQPTSNSSRRLYGTIANRSDSLRLSGRVVGLPASCANVELAGYAATTQNSTAADVQDGRPNRGRDPVFAEVVATQGVDTAGGVQRTTLAFQFDINIDNAPYKAQLYADLRSRNLTGATPPVGLSFNAFARCTTPVDLGGGIVLQNWKITPGLEQLPWEPQLPDSLVFDDKNWAWNTILFTTDYLPQGFITHPESVTVAAGTAASFSTSAWPVPVGEQRIEWWRSDNDGASWTRVRTTIVPVNATVDTYTIAATAPTDHNALLRARLCAVPRTATPAEACTDGIAARLTVLQGVAAASFSLQPRPVLVRSGQTASFSVAVDGAPAPTLRWQARPANSSGAWVDVSTGSGAATLNYTTAALALSDNGLQLRAVANNVVGDLGSVPVTVSVSDVDVAPSISSQPAALSVVAGSEAVFAVVARGTEALSYQWRRNGVAITGANAPVLKLAAVSEADATGYSVQVSNTAGTATSDPAQLSVSAGAAPAVAPTIVTQPVSVLVNSGNTATFAVGVSGSGPLSYQWQRNAVPITGATSAFYSIAAVAVGDAATYSVKVGNSAGSVTSSSVVLTVNQSEQAAPVTLVSHPSPQIQPPGGSATFAVAVTGSGPITYQWLKNGAPVNGATSGVLTLTSLVAEDAASYSVTVGNGLGSVTSNAATLTVLGVPAISSQPAATTAVAGNTASFSVAATGAGLRYQWLRNAVAIAGATQASYTTLVLTEADSGAVFSVLVYNGAGVVFSNSAVLTVTPLVAPSFSTQPTDLGVIEPAPATFTAVVGGSPVPTLQWQISTDGGSNWVDIAGATSASYTTAATARADSGKQYRVVATNSAGPIASAVATLTVTLATPPLSAPLNAGKIAVGTFHTCAVKADATAACWGHGSSGQVRPGSTSDDWTPQGIPGLSGVTYVAAGQVQSCAIDGTGTLWCWGGGRGLAAVQNGSGVNYTGVKAVAMGLLHQCFIDAGTTVRCWGNNSGGQLGVDPALTGTGYVATPVFVNRLNSIPLTGVVSLSADGDGNNTCALTSDGEVVCWGNGNFVALPVVTGATAMRDGSGHGCAVMAAGGMKCWGANGNGQLGNRSTTASPVPVSVIDLPGLLGGVTSIATQSTNTCVVPATGRVVCWGAVDPDRLNGNNTFGPTEKGNLAQRVAALSSGRAQTCALVVDGSIECWGSNQFGQLGLGHLNAINSGGPFPPSTSVVGGAIFWH